MKVVRRGIIVKDEIKIKESGFKRTELQKMIHESRFRFFFFFLGWGGGFG
jgi:hypothetical protein